MKSFRFIADAPAYVLVKKTASYSAKNRNKRSHFFLGIMTTSEERMNLHELQLNKVMLFEFYGNFEKPCCTFHDLQKFDLQISSLAC